MPISLTHDIWFVVRVPVLSEQITVVQPRVSTDGSFLQSACTGLMAITACDSNACNVSIITYVELHAAVIW